MYVNILYFKGFSVHNKINNMSITVHKKVFINTATFELSTKKNLTWQIPQNHPAQNIADLKKIIQRLF